MNIDSLLNLDNGVYVLMPEGVKVPGEVSEILGDEGFLFAPRAGLNVVAGAMVRISDGQESILARVVENTPSGVKMCVECYASPGKERRQDVRIYDKIYFSTKFLCHGNRKMEILPGALHRIRANRLVIDSFLKGKYGYPGADETPYTRETPQSQAIWEINRKLDLLIHMYLAEDFGELMKSAPRDVNISASGIRFISSEPFENGDLVEISLIFPMVPLLFVRLVGEVIRVRAVTSQEARRYAVAVRFIQLDTESKDDIIRYLFRRQRELLRKRHA
ncbi:MAG: PilZ domain-containing protein [Desulfomonilia bacterium]|jgi:hypothetical protein